MKIAIPYENGQVFLHFGKSEQFFVATIEEGKVITTEVISTDGQGHSALGVLLSMHHINVLICGGIGGGAINFLSQMGIKVFAGNSGDVNEVVKQYLAGELDENKEANCHHHEEGGEHHCSSNGHCCH